MMEAISRMKDEQKGMFRNCNEDNRNRYKSMKNK